MKLITTLAFALVFAGTTFAQETITASATVLNKIEFGEHQNIAFGELLAGNSTSIASDSSDAGFFTISSFEPSKSLAASAAITAESFTEGSGTVNFTIDPLTYSIGASPAPSTTPAGTSFSLSGSDPVNENVYLYVGAALDATNATFGGAFSATISLTVDYL